MRRSLVWSGRFYVHKYPVANLDENFQAPADQINQIGQPPYGMDQGIRDQVGIHCAIASQTANYTFVLTQFPIKTKSISPTLK
jgi:hypothetical protein